MSLEQITKMRSRKKLLSRGETKRFARTVHGS